MNIQNDSTTIQSIRSNGWQQGSILRKISDDNGFTLKNGLYLLLSQDCDICHGNLVDEPCVEIINFKSVTGSLDGNLTHGKNPRRLQLRLSDMNYYELHAKDRQFIKREILGRLSPDLELQTPEKSLRVLISWIKKRYDRDAFPFVFDERFSKRNRDKLKKILQNKSKEIIGVFIRLNSMDELSSAENYIIDLVLLIDEDMGNREDLQETLEKIYQLLNGNEGIEVLPGYRILTTREISLEEFMTLSELDHDYISFRDDDKEQLKNQ